MNLSALSASVSSRRRFVLLPEEPLDVRQQRPRVRRYQLASVARGAGARCSGTSALDSATAELVRELGGLVQL